MTEDEWLTATDPQPMLKFLRETASERKLRLFACAHARQFWSQLNDDQCRGAVEVAEQFADGGSSERNRNNAFQYTFGLVVHFVEEQDFERAAVIRSSGCKWTLLGCL